jgi:hypothetical protein
MNCISLIITSVEKNMESDLKRTVNKKNLPSGRFFSKKFKYCYFLFSFFSLCQFD